MNIKKYYIFVLAATITSCSTELDSLLNDSGKQKFVTLTADIANNDVGSRSAYGSDGAFTWGTNEEIAVNSNGTFNKFSMTAGGGTNKATFSGTVAESVTSTYALYPYRSDYTETSSEGTTSINYVLPAKYDDYVPGTTQANLPMYSTIADVSTGEVKFYMTVGALRYTMKNLPEGTKSLTFVTDQNITGKAVVDVTNSEAPYLKTPDGKQYVTYNLKDALTATTDVTIDVPLPAGTYKAFGVDIKKEDGTILKSVDFLKTATITAGHIQKVSFDYATSANAYTIPSTGLPSVIIVTPNKADITSKDVWTDGTLYSIHKADGSIDAFGTMSMKGRGNSTWGYPKKPYAMKLDNKSKVLGMNKHKRWCLLANWMDRTMMRNAVSFEIARKCPGLAWTPSGEFVELVLNGTHQGNYYLCEQIKVDKNRVNIAELNNTVTEGDGITGGFIMELDVNYDETNKFKSATKQLPYQFKDPDDPNSTQTAWMESYVNSMESALYDNTKFANREFADYMNLESFVDWWFVHELTMNWEPNHPKSSYMHKDVASKNGKITAGPVWDFDWETFIPSRTSSFTVKTAIYYEQLFKDATFVALVKSRWQQEKSKFEEVYTFIDGLQTKLASSDVINHEKWPIGTGTNGDGNMTYEDAVARLKNAYKAKLEWMDDQINNLNESYTEGSSSSWSWH